MGILYRPERSVATVLHHTQGDLADTNGVYWKHVLSDEATPSLSVLGNTTRIYPFLDATANNLNSMLKNRYAGYYKRDLVKGILPEMEDVQEAVESTSNIRDVYLPPDGDGHEEVDIDR